MKKRYEIHFNPEQLTEEQIQKHKNFEAILQQFEKTQPKPAYRQLHLMAGSIAAAIALLVAVYFALRPSANLEEIQRAYFASRPFIDPPLTNIQPQFASYQINNQMGGMLEHPTGSKLQIPPAAFVNNQGIPVEGHVTLRYREMHDFVDFFLAGIPMVYDSAGVEYTLESAGMIEVYAEQNGEKLILAKDKTIGVELVSRVNVSPSLELPTGFNIYKLDETARKWVYTAVNRMSLLNNDPHTLTPSGNEHELPSEYVEQLHALNLKLENEKRKIEQSLPIPPKPYKPQKANSDDYVFELDFSAISQPDRNGNLSAAQREVAKLYQAYDKMLWRIAAGASIDPEKLRSQFAEVEEVSITQTDGTAYEIQLSRGSERISILAEPVLTGSDYTKALSEYETALQDWQQKMTQRQRLLHEKIEALEAAFEDEKHQLTEKFKDQLASHRQQNHHQNSSLPPIAKTVVNRFEINSLGIWNCDRPLPPYMVKLTASFVDQEGKPLTNLKGYLVDKDRNTIGTFYVSDKAVVRFNASSKKLLWLVTEDGKIALFPADEFAQVGNDAQTFTFRLRKIDQELKDENDVRKVLIL